MDLSLTRVIGSSGRRRPAAGVMICTPGTPGGGFLNLSAYANLPRKYRPLMKLKTSQRGTLELLRRSARSNCALGLKSIFARIPPESAGESKKILRGSKLSRLPEAGVFGSGECPSNVIRFSAKV
jgi:hypothetical protein